MGQRKNGPVFRKQIKNYTRSVTTKKRKLSSPSVTVIAEKGSTQNKQLILCRKNATGLERLLCPYNTFEITRQLGYKKSTMSDNANYYTGLPPTQRNYLVGNCQRRGLRFASLKMQAAEAIKEKKVFLINGQCNPLRKALVTRGWVEKVPARRMDVTSIRCRNNDDTETTNTMLERLLLSSLVEKVSPNLVWYSKDDFDSRKENNDQTNSVMYNRLGMDVLWTSKQGLCTAMENYRWCHIKGVAEVAYPRTFTTYSEDDREDITEDYKLTACTSLLKWLISMVAFKANIFSENGTISFNVIVFALNQCKNYLLIKHNYDIDWPTPKITAAQWKSFLDKYYYLTIKKGKFHLDTKNQVPVYVEYAKIILKEMCKYRPQLSCEGCHNIWIIKPTLCSRGRGIRIASKLGVLSDLIQRDKYVCQKYIEEPLLIHETKFDIRQYFLVTSTVPLEIWMYKDCYLKFSSQKFSIKDFHESIHLTNHAIQKNYKNCTDRHPDLPLNNMWNLETYKEYLRKQNKEHLWSDVIYPGMRKAILGTMLCCQDSLYHSKHRFELYGCDFILDKDFKPWLIEINATPDLKPTTTVTRDICSAVIADTVKVVFDRARDKNASNGNFECICRQTMSSIVMGSGVDFAVYGHTLPPDYFYQGSNPPVDEVLSKSIFETSQEFNALLEQINNEASHVNSDCVCTILPLEINSLTENISSHDKNIPLKTPEVLNVSQWIEGLKSNLSNTDKLRDYLKINIPDNVTVKGSVESFSSDFSSSCRVNGKNNFNSGEAPPTVTVPMHKINSSQIHPLLESKDKTRNPNFGDYEIKKMKLDHVVKESCNSYTNIQRNEVFREVVLVAKDLVSFLKRKEDEYSGLSFILK